MAKKAITYILNEKTLKSLVNHTGLDALNRSYWYHHDRVRDLMTKTEREIFFLINKYSVKYYGVSYMSHRTIAKLIGCSTKTVQRAYRRLVELDVIESFEAKRTSDMRQTASIVRIIPMPQPEEQPEINNVQQETGENVQPETPSPKHSLVSSNAFEKHRVTRHELANAFDIPEWIVHATLPLCLSDDKFVELFSRCSEALRSKVEKEAFRLSNKHFLAMFYSWSYQWDTADEGLVRCVRSAAIRTNYMAKQKPINNIAGYFINTFWDLYEKELREIIAFYDEESPGWCVEIDEMVV